MTITAPSKFTTVDDIEDLVLDLLGALLNESVAGLRARLESAGPGMPIDSLDLFDIVSDFRAATGFKLPPKRMTRTTMKSIRSFSEYALKEASS